MKKYLIFVVGFILGMVGTSLAAYKLRASEVSFDKTNTELNSDTVQDGIDELADLLKYGTATANDIKEGKTALVNGEKITGLGSSYELIGVVSEAAAVTKTLEKSYKYIILFDSKSNWSIGLNNNSTSIISDYENKTLIKQIQGNTKADDVYFANVTVYENVPSGSTITLGDPQAGNLYGLLHVAIGIN